MERIEKIKEILQQSPQDSFLQHALALEYLKKGERQQARELWEKLLAGNPEYVGSYYQLAQVLESLGEKEAARYWYVAGIEKARAADDRRTLSELQAAYENMIQ